MKIKSFINIFNIILVILTILISGILLINLNYNFHIKEEVRSLFREAQNIENNINELHLPSIELINKGEVSFVSELKPVLDDISNFFVKWDIYFKIYKNDELIYSINNDQFSTSKINSSLINRKLYMITTNENITILTVRLPAFYKYGNLSISLNKDISHIKKYKRTQSFILLIIVVIMASILLPVSHLFTRYITTPIDRLIISIRDFSNKQEDCKKTVSFDEITILEDSFKQLQKEILQQITLLKQESRSKEIFIDKLNHELNTPITAIKGFSELLLNSQYDELLFKKCLVHIKNETNRVTKLNHNLQELLLSKTDHRWSKILVKDIVFDVKNNLEVLLQEKDLQLEILLKNNYVKGNKDLLFTLIKNLLHNSIKASDNKKVISIYDEYINERYYLRLTDHGVGFMNVQELKIKDLYIKGEYLNNEVKSSGIGLALCDEIIEYHNCSFTLTNKEEGGVMAIMDFTNILHFD